MRNMIMAAAMAVTTLVVPAQAETFYEEEIGYWYVFGDTGNVDQNPACVIDYEWGDGSVFQLTYDLYSRELFIWFQNFEWDIVDPIDSFYEMNMVIVGYGDNLGSGRLSYYLVNKNTIIIPDITPTPFLDDFAGLNELRFIMPGTIQNAYLDLENSRMATESFIRCIRQGNTMNFETYGQPLGEQL